MKKCYFCNKVIKFYCYEVLKEKHVCCNCMVKLVNLQESNIQPYLKEIKALKEQINDLKTITETYNTYPIEKTRSNCKIIIADKDYFLDGTFTNNFISKDYVKQCIKKLRKRKNEYNEQINTYLETYLETELLNNENTIL